MSSTNTPTGITGNTAASNMNANAAPAATAQRQQSMGQTISRWSNIGIGIGLVIVGIILSTTELSFWWTLVVAAVLIFGGNKLASLKINFLKPWSGIIRFSGWIVLATVLLTSGFGYYAGEKVNSAEAWANCQLEENKATPECLTVTATTPATATLPAGCSTYIGADDLLRMYQEDGVATLRRGNTLCYDTSSVGYFHWVSLDARLNPALSTENAADRLASVDNLPTGEHEYRMVPSGANFDRLSVGDELHLIMVPEGTSPEVIAAKRERINARSAAALSL